MQKSRQIGIFINQLLNILWSIACFTPIVMYWLDHGAEKWLYAFLFLSVVIAFMPKTFFNKLKLFGSKISYENWGVKTFRKFVQEGNHRWANRTPTKYISNMLDASRYLNKIAMYERYHWCCLIFFVCTSIHCFVHGEVIYGVIITMANVIYNVPTLLLQQYNRLRINALKIKYRLNK